MDDLKVGLLIDSQNVKFFPKFVSEEAFVVKLSYHPDFVEIIPVLLENPKTQPICRRNRKNTNFDPYFKEQLACKKIF